MRYEVVTESVSGHCCFVATVIDTLTGNSGYCKDIVCECMDVASAELICNVLNEQEEG